MLKNKKGMTLVETIVTIAVFSIAAMILATGFATVIRYISEANDIKNTGNEVFAQIESKENALEKKSTNIRITMEDGSKIEDKISKMTARKRIADKADAYEIRFTKLSKDQIDEDTSLTFYEIVAKAVEHCLDESSWYKEYNAKLEALKDEGVKGLEIYKPLTVGFLSNDNFINYVFITELDGSVYPVLDEKIVTECNRLFDETSGKPSQTIINEIRIGTRKMYMKCIYMPDRMKAFLVADEYPSTPKVSTWKTRLIYNPDDQHWYYKVHYATDNTTAPYYFNVANFKTEAQWENLLLSFKDPTQWRKIEKK